MNQTHQSQIHPALRQQPPAHTSAYPSPQKPADRQSQGTDQHYAQAAYSPIQASPSTSYQSIQTPQYYGGGNVQSPDDADQSPDAADDGAGNAHDPNDLKRPRACEACRQLKVKCELDDNTPNASCKRCAKANRQCIVTAPSRKRQKKTDSRVAELEKKIDALTATLVARGGHSTENIDPVIASGRDLQTQRNGTLEEPAGYRPPGVLAAPQSTHTAVTGVKRKAGDSDYFAAELHRPTSDFKAPPVPSMSQIHMINKELAKKGSDDMTNPDVVERGIIDLKSATRCFERYVAEMCVQLPLVVFKPGTQFDEVRESKPLLFLAILAVSAGTIRPEIQQKLITEATRILADRILFRGQKSLELVQTIQVMTIFYMPPEKYEELNFNQLIHIGAVMALDIGMGKRSKFGAFAMWKEYMDKKQPLPDSNAAETRRCWLGCYYMCANSSMSLRRPLLIRWSPYAEECLEILATSPDALPSDQWLCQLVRAQHIAEEIGFQFSMDDPATQLSLIDSKTQWHLKNFERELAEWQDLPNKDMIRQPLMRHTYAIINLYMHEIAMHHNHNIDDFKPPFNVSPVEGPPDPDSVTPAHIESLTACLNSIHGAFDAFLSMDLKTLRSLPTLFFVRNSYAAVALIKMYSAIAARGSKFGTIFKPAELKVETYLDRMIGTLTKTGEGGASRVAYKFSFIFNMLKNWHLKRIEPTAMNGSGRNATTPGPVQASGERRTPNMKNVVELFNQGMERHPDSMSTATAMAWNGPQPPVPDAATPSGLQMLSDAAMGNSANPGSSTTPSSANTPNTAMRAASPVQPPPPPGLQKAQQAQRSGPWTMGPPPPNNANMMMTTGPNDMQAFGGDASMMAGYPMGPVEMDNFGFTSDELMAMGNLMEDPAWFSFGMEQGGWAF